MLKGIGYAICIIDVYVGMFYNTVIGWAVYYFVQSIMSAAQYTYSDQVGSRGILLDCEIMSRCPMSRCPNLGPVTAAAPGHIVVLSPRSIPIP